MRLRLGMCRMAGLIVSMLLRTPPGQASKAKIDHSSAMLRETRWFPFLKPKAGSPYSALSPKPDLPPPAPQGNVDSHATQPQAQPVGVADRI